MLKDFFQSASVNVLIIFVSTIQGVLVARILLAEGKGEIAVFMSIYNIIYALSNLGIRQSSAFYFSKENMKVKDLSRVHLMGVFISFLITSVVLFVSFQLNDIFSLPIFLSFVFAIPFALYTTYTTSFALSNRWIDKLNIVKLITCVVFFSLFVLFYVLLGLRNLKYYFYAFLISHLATFIYVYSWSRRITGYSLFVTNFLKTLKDLKMIVTKGISYALPLFIYGINFKADILILNNLVPSSEIGVYSVGVTFAEIIWQLPAILSMLIFSYSVSDKDPEVFSRNLWNRNKKIMLILIPLLIVYFFTIDFLIPYVYGSEFTYSSHVTLFLLPGTYAIISFNILNADMAARGYPQMALGTFTIAAICNIILNFVLVPYFGIEGAAISSSITYIVASLYFIRGYYILTFKG